MAKNHMAEVAKMLGVELGEEFEIAGGERIYRFCENGLYDDDDFFCCALLKDLLVGDHHIKKLPWRPKDGKLYYYWIDNETDLAIGCDNFYSTHLFDLKNVMIGNYYPTKEAAEADKDKFMALMKAAQEAVRK